MRQLLCLAALLLLAACGSGSSTSTPPTGENESLMPTESDGNSQPGDSTADDGDNSSADSGQSDDECSVAAQNQWVDDNMRDYYLFYDQVPQLNLADYDSPRALIRDLRVPPDVYSSVRNAAVVESTVVEGREVWFGYSWRQHTDNTARIAYVYDDSPMGRAGVRRGDQIISLNTLPWADIDNELFATIVGTAESPNITTWTFFRESDSTSYSIAVAMEEYSINAVLATGVFSHPDYDGSVGYLAYQRFIEPSDEELDLAMEQFRSQGITDLILDLRYSRGGRAGLARKLSSQIGGPATDNQRFSEYRFNDRYQEENYEELFPPQILNLGMNRLVVLSTGDTAGVSELVINGLRPYIPVTLFGEEQTEGNPYISFPENLDPCGIRMFALEAEAVNASGVSAAGGLLPDCAASDDLTSDWGINDSTVEGMLETALDSFVFGICENPASNSVPNWASTMALRQVSATADDHMKQMPRQAGISTER